MGKRRLLNTSFKYLIDLFTQVCTFSAIVEICRVCLAALIRDYLYSFCFNSFC